MRRFVILDTLSELAKGAGNLIKNYFRNLESKDIEKKGHSHYVTIADKESEEFLVKGLRSEFPDIGICAEESIELSGKGRFLIDPLDGTHNFMHGIPHFCISIAYELDSKMNFSVIYDPIKEELFHAERGNGAFLNGHTIKPSKIENFEKALITLGFPPTAYHRRDKFMNAIKDLIIKVNSVRLFGSAALNLAYLSAGRIDGDIEFGLSPWDVAAGWLLAEEAGAIITDEKGKDSILMGNIIASTSNIHSNLLKFVQENML